MRLLVTILFLSGATTAFGDMRGEVVCGVPADEAVAYVFETRPGVWRYIGIHGMHYEDRGHPSADEALAAYAPEQAEYVCDVEVEGTPPITAQLYRLHHSFIPRGATNEQGEPLDWDYDPRGSILNVAATAATNPTTEADTAPLGFCGIPLAEATVVVEHAYTTYRAFSPHSQFEYYASDIAGAIYDGGRVRSPDFWREYRGTVITAEDADCRFRVVAEGDSGTYAMHVLVYRLAKPLQEGQVDAQSFFAEYRAEYLDQMPWGGRSR